MPDALAKLSRLSAMKVKDSMSFDISVVMAVLSTFGTNHCATRNFPSAGKRIPFFIPEISEVPVSRCDAYGCQPADVNGAGNLQGRPN